MRYTYLANYCDLTDRAKWERKQKDTRNNLKRFPCGLIESARFLTRKSYDFSMCYSIIRLLILFLVNFQRLVMQFALGRLSMDGMISERKIGFWMSLRWFANHLFLTQYFCTW